MFTSSLVQGLKRSSTNYNLGKVQKRGASPLLGFHHKVNKQNKKVRKTV